MSNTDKQLAELLAEEKKMLEQQKKEQDGAQAKTPYRQETAPGEERKRKEHRRALLGRCMMQKFSSDPGAKEAMLQELDAFLSKPEDRELFGLV